MHQVHSKIQTFIGDLEDLLKRPACPLGPECVFGGGWGTKGAKDTLKLKDALGGLNTRLNHHRKVQQTLLHSNYIVIKGAICKQSRRRLINHIAEVIESKAELQETIRPEVRAPDPPDGSAVHGAAEGRVSA